MSEQSPERQALNEEAEVEGHLKAGLNEDPSRAALSDDVDEDGPEVEGHVKTRAPEDPSRAL